MCVCVCVCNTVRGGKHHSGQSSVSLLPGNMSFTSAEKMFTLELFKRYEVNKKYLTLKTQYHGIIESIKSVATGVNNKSRNDFYLLSMQI